MIPAPGKCARAESVGDLTIDGELVTTSYGSEVDDKLGSGGMAGRNRVVATEWSTYGCQKK